MSNLYREPSMHADYQVSFHLLTRLQRKRLFRNRPIRKNELPMAAMFVDGSELPSFNLLGQATSEKKIKIWKVNGRQTIDDRRRTPIDGKSSLFLWQGELKTIRKIVKKCVQCRSRRQPWKRRTLFKENNNFDVWDYYYTYVVVIMKLCLFNSIGS